MTKDEQIALLTIEKKSFRDGLLESGVVVLRQSKEIALLKDKIKEMEETKINDINEIAAKVAAGAISPPQK